MKIQVPEDHIQEVAIFIIIRNVENSAIHWLETHMWNYLTFLPATKESQ